MISVLCVEGAEESPPVEVQEQMDWLTVPVITTMRTWKAASPACKAAWTPWGGRSQWEENRKKRQPRNQTFGFHRDMEGQQSQLHPGRRLLTVLLRPRPKRPVFSSWRGVSQWRWVVAFIWTSHPSFSCGQADFFLKKSTFSFGLENKGSNKRRRKTDSASINSSRRTEAGSGGGGRWDDGVEGSQPVPEEKKKKKTLPPFLLQNFGVRGLHRLHPHPRRLRPSPLRPPPTRNASSSTRRDAHAPSADASPTPEPEPAQSKRRLLPTNFRKQISTKQWMGADFLIMEYICVAFVFKGILTVLFPSKPGTTKCSSSLNDHWGQVSERRLFLWALAWSCVTDFQLTSRPLSDFYLRLTAFVDFAKTEQIQGVVTYFSHNKLLQSISDSSQTSSRRKKQTDVSRTFWRKA